MNRGLEFEVDWEIEQGEVETEAVTFASLGIETREGRLTRVEDLLSQTTRKVIRVSAYPLAVWLSSNWWRLRWEGPGDGHDWEMSHNVAAAGSGYVWPDLEIVSSGDIIRLKSRESQESTVGSIAYLGNIESHLPARDFVAAIDEFVETVIARLVDTGHRETPLRELWSLVKEERQDPDSSEYRKLEALLGFDAEEGPSDRIERLIEAGRHLGSDAIAEVAASDSEVVDWDALEDQLQQSDRVTIGEFDALRRLARQAAVGRYAWQRGESAARQVRRAVGASDGPIDDTMLEDWLSLPGDILQRHPTSDSSFAAGYREASDSSEMRILFRSSYHEGRRFEVARLIGEHLVTAPEADHMMPATRAKTVRQSTQRAFAAEFLLPLADLKDSVGDQPIDEDLIEEVAREFEVSPLMVSTRLLNKDIIDRQML